MKTFFSRFIIQSTTLFGLCDRLRIVIFFQFLNARDLSCPDRIGDEIDCTLAFPIAHRFVALLPPPKLIVRIKIGNEVFRAVWRRSSVTRQTRADNNCRYPDDFHLQLPVNSSALPKEYDIKLSAFAKSFVFIPTTRRAHVNLRSKSINTRRVPCVGRGSNEPRPADLRQRTRHPGVRHDVRDEKRTAVLDVGAAACALQQPGTDDQTTGPAAEDAPVVAAKQPRPSSRADNLNE